jgi:hypothetical protein
LRSFFPKTSTATNTAIATAPITAGGANLLTGKTEVEMGNVCERERDRMPKAADQGGPPPKQASLLLAVFLSVRPSCLFRVMSSVGGVAVRGVCMVTCFFMVPGVVVFARFCVVVSSMRGVFCCLLVMFRSFLGHGVFPPLFGCPSEGLIPRETTKLAHQRSVPL